MFKSRRGRIACLFALVLLMELALLCCASMHLSDHVCPDCHHCPICACVRSGLNRVAIAPLLTLALLALTCASAEHPVRRGASPFHSLFARKVRLND